MADLSSDLIESAAFDRASAAVVAYLSAKIPLGLWSVSRYDGERQVHLTVGGDYYGLKSGDGIPWTDSMCQHMVAGTAPRIAPDAMAIPMYAGTQVAADAVIGAYVGIPLRRAGGGLFGTLCAIDPAVQPAALVDEQPMLELIGMLLGQVLDADIERTAAARAAEDAECRSETDAMTGLLNRRGWDRTLHVEEDRYRRYGDPCTILVLDLDGLKKINDTEGHAAGDAYIVRSAQVMREVARGSDVLARLGGDEFGIVVSRSGEREAAALQHRLQDALDAAGVACSIGAAALSMQDGLRAAWNTADERMYATKQRRRVSGRLDLVS